MGKDRAAGRTRAGGIAGGIAGGGRAAHRFFFEAAAEGMLLTAADGAVLDANAEACRLLRRSDREELVGAGRGAVFDASDPRLAPAQEELRRRGSFRGGLRLMRGDGTALAAGVSAALLGGDGAVDGAVGVVFRDPAERGEASGRGAAEAGGLYRTLVERMPAVTYVQDVARGFAASYVSPQVEALLGYAPGEFVADPDLCRKLLHPDDRERVIAEDERTDRTGEPFSMEYRLIAKDGSVVWVRDEAALLRDGEGAPLLWQGVQLDITRQKRAEEALKGSEERFGSLVRNSQDVITLIDADGTVRYASPAVERLLGYRPEERVGENTFGLVHPEDAARARRLLAEGLRSPGVPLFLEARVRHRDGSYRHVEATGANLLDDPSVGAVVLNVRDVTERARAREDLREREERFRATFDRAAVGLAHVAPDGRFLRVNNRLCEIVGFAREELLERSFGDITHSDDLVRDLGLLRRLLAGEIGEYSMEKRYVRKDYSQVWASLTVSLERKPSGEPSYLVSVVEDITPRKRAEALFRTLTPRETEVLKLLARGKTNGEIARELKFSVATVKNRVHGITTKLGVPDRTAAAARAAELGLFAPAGDGPR